MDRRRVVIVGGGVAAMAAAHALRGAGYDGGVTIVGDEPRPPYERPPLSKDYLTGAAGPADLHPFPETWYEDNDVELLTGTRVDEVSVAERRVVTERGSLGFDALLLATGGRPRRIGPDHERVLTLRTIDDADALGAFLRPGARVVVVGGGFIGCEIASSARAAGAEVVLAEAAARPMAVLGEVGDVLARIHRDHGVELHLGAPVEAVEPGSDGIAVRVAGGRVLEGDVAVVGLGIVPRDELAARAGLAASDGVIVDESCRTAAEGVFAAGDVARHRHPMYEAPVRVEHFDNALRQGAVVGRVIAGQSARHDEPHWFWSDQYGHNLQVTGDPSATAQAVTRGVLGPRGFTRFLLRDGVVRGAITLDRPAEARVARRLVGRRVPPELLGDEDVELRSLLRRDAH